MSPRSLPEEDLRKVLDALSAGVDRPTAAQYVNLAPAAFVELLKTDASLRSAVESAEAAARVANIGAIAKAARGDWRAASFLLERTPPPAPTSAAGICGAPTHPLNGGGPCRRIKGWGTKHPGSGNCRSHFGNSANGKKHAATEAAAMALESARIALGIPVEMDPKRALLEQVWEAAGNVAFLRERVAEMGPDLTLMSQDQIGSRLVIRDDIRAMVKLYNEERDRLAKVAKMTIDAGVSESLVAIARSTAESIAAVVNAVLEGLELPEEQRERGRVIAGTKLRLLSPRAA